MTNHQTNALRCNKKQFTAFYTLLRPSRDLTCREHASMPQSPPHASARGLRMTSSCQHMLVSDLLAASRHSQPNPSRFAVHASCSKWWPPFSLDPQHLAPLSWTCHW